MPELELNIEIKSAADANAETIFQFLVPFMDQQFLLDREVDEIARLLPLGFAAYHELRLVGFAAVEIYSRKLAELQCLAVVQEYRRQGVGRALVSRCCEVAQAAGVKELMAISNSDEMFKACGFDYSLPNQKRALFFQARDDH